MLVVDCATNSTLQELKTNSSGVFAYEETDDFQSVTSNRYISWRTCDDILELSEHSLNKNLIDSVLKIQFKNTLILPNGVSIHETPDRIFVLVTTLVSAHRFAFNHPNKLLSNPTGISSALSYLNNTAGASQSSDLLGYSIFHNVPVDNSVGNSCQLPNSTSQNTMLGPASPFPYLASCSWINSNLEAYFVVSKNTGALHVIKLPSPSDVAAEPKVHTIDLKQNSFIGMTMNLITGMVPSLKSTSSGDEAAISLLSHSTTDDDLIFALCRDCHIRVLSLKKQECIIVHSLLNNQQQMQSQLHSPSASYPARDGFTAPGQQGRKPVSIKLWWHGDDTNTLLPNLVVYLSGTKHKSFYFFETVIRQRNSTLQVHQSQSASMNSSFSATHTVANQTSPHLKFLVEVIAPVEQDLIDYFVADNQIWALMQHNDTFSLQYYSIESPNCPAQSQNSVHPPLEWMPIISDVNLMPEMEARSPLCNSREYFLKEIFWRGHFSLTTIAKAINVANRVSIDEEKINSANLKIDQLVREAIDLVDSIIRNQIDENHDMTEVTVEQYTKQEFDAWNKLYEFCLGYHAEENKPLSIFVDYKTGAKGIVRQGKIDFIPSLDPFDELIDYYFLLCKESSSQVDLPNGTLDSIFSRGSSNLTNLNSEPALDYRLNTLMARLDPQITGVFASALQQSIRELLIGMSAISRSLSEEDLLNFATLMNRMSSFSSKTSKSLSDIAKMIAEDSLLPEMNLADNPGHDIYDFFNRCPMVVEAINFLLSHINFAFTPNSDDFPFNFSDSVEGDGEETAWKMYEALQYNINPLFANLLSSRCGLSFVVSSVNRIVSMRYTFCRDLFLFQYFLNKFRFNLRADYMTKITQIEADTIPNTTQQLFALDYLSWAAQTPMINPNIWWSLSDDQSGNTGLTSIVNAISTTPPKNALKSTVGNTSSLENSELLSVLELREYINLNRIGILSHESTFYDAYPQCTILHFFIQFSGGILAKRLISYKLAVQHGDDLSPAINNIWSKIVSSYLTSVGQLLWPLSAGQLKLAEFLLGVAQYDLLERFNQRLHWCIEHPHSRFFLKGICSLVTGDGQKAIRHLQQALSGVDYEMFLSRIFSKKAARRAAVEGGDEGAGSVRTRTLASETEDVLSNARTIFRYYNKLIQLFKRYSSPDFVVELVEIALNTLDPEKDPEYEEHHSSLHSTLFACHLQLGNANKAYDAMISNLDADQRRICLRQFILNLCETGELATLVSHQYHGLEEEFVSILEWKARTSSARLYSGRHFHALDNLSTTSRMSASTAGSGPSSVPINYHHILYAYFIKVNNYRRAAQSMYDYYRQLNQEASTYATSDAIELLQKQADALLVARNCLKLVDPTQSWITKNAAKRTDGAAEGAETKQKLKRKRGISTDYGSPQEKDTAIDTVDDEELWCEFELVNARLRLLQRNTKEYAIASTLLSPEETVILCIGACLYEHAFRISTHFKLPLEPIFDGMASKYVQLLNGAYNRRRIDDEMVLALLDGEMGIVGGPYSQYSGDPMASPSNIQSFNIDLLDIFYENGSNAAKSSFISYSTLSICDRMWHLIMHYLERYETTPQSSSHLMKQVAEKLLSNGIMLPASLLKVYQKVNCPELIRLLMTYNFLPEATHVSLDYMNAFMGHGTEYFDMKHHLYAKCPPLCIPMHIFECLLKILREESEESKLESWQNRLATEDNTDALHGVIASVDDYVNEEKVDYEGLYKALSKRKQKLHDAIVSCSR